MKTHERRRTEYQQYNTTKSTTEGGFKNTRLIGDAKKKENTSETHKRRDYQNKTVTNI